ncbi:hypothetical protein FALCPG4_015941 [Fusarium falciforme]
MVNNPKSVRVNGYLVPSHLRRENTDESPATTTVHYWHTEQSQEIRQPEVAAETNWQPATVSNHLEYSSSQPMLPELDLSDMELDLESSGISKGQQHSQPVPGTSKVRKSTHETEEETSDYEHDSDSDDEDDGRPIHPSAMRLNAQDNMYSPAQWENEEVDYEGSQYYRRTVCWRCNVGKMMGEMK